VFSSSSSFRNALNGEVISSRLHFFVVWNVVLQVSALKSREMNLWRMKWWWWLRRVREV
jgi:hypothetical protein